MSNIKANEVAVDLTKKFVDIVKDNNKKKNQNSNETKKPLT